MYIFVHAGQISDEICRLKILANFQLNINVKYFILIVLEWRKTWNNQHSAPDP